MKPQIFISKNGKIEVTKEELEKLVDNAYWEGYTDGYNAGKKEGNCYPTNTPINPITPYVPPTITDPKPWWTEITYSDLNTTDDKFSYILHKQNY